MKKSLVLIFFWATTLLGYTVFPVELTSDGKILFQVDNPTAQKISVAGSFNEWNKEATLMKKDNMGIWFAELQLSPGQYEYKIVINDQNWVPSDNLKFAIVLQNGQVVLKGGKGFSVAYEKKSNFTLSDRIYINGAYHFIFIPYYNFSTHQGSILKNRHIIELNPQIYINDNAGLQMSLLFDSTASSLFLWKAKVDFKQPQFVLTLFNNKAFFALSDPLESLSESTYSSKYPLLIYPIDFYNSSSIKKFGNNYRGLFFSYKTPFFLLNTMYAHPLYGNFDMSFGLVQKDIAIFRLALLGIMKRGKYETYPVDETSWTKIDSSDSYYQIFPNTLQTNGAEFVQQKLGAWVHLNINAQFSLFLEYLKVKKTGGFYFRTVQSDGSDLPEDFSTFGSSYAKSASVFESPYTGYDFATGAQLKFPSIQEEIQWKVLYRQYNIQTLSNAMPMVISYQSITKVQFSFFNIKNKIQLIQGKEKIQKYNYHILFDEYNFYHYYMTGAYQKFSVYNQMIFLFNLWNMKCNTRYNQYAMHDIYFGNTKKWHNTTIENWISVNYKIHHRLSLIGGQRLKYYDYADYITANNFESFQKLYWNFYIGTQYSLSHNIKLTLTYGLVPTLNEDYFDGFSYYLNENTSRVFPFFKDAEELLSENQFLSFKGDIVF